MGDRVITCPNQNLDMSAIGDEHIVTKIDDAGVYLCTCGARFTVTPDYIDRLKALVMSGQITSHLIDEPPGVNDDYLSIKTFPPRKIHPNLPGFNSTQEREAPDAEERPAVLRVSYEQVMITDLPEFSKYELQDNYVEYVFRITMDNMRRITSAYCYGLKEVRLVSALSRQQWEHQQRLDEAKRNTVTFQIANIISHVIDDPEGGQSLSITANRDQANDTSDKSK